MLCQLSVKPESEGEEEDENSLIGIESIVAQTILKADPSLSPVLSYGMPIRQAITESAWNECLKQLSDHFQVVFEQSEIDRVHNIWELIALCYRTVCVK